jgi:hypothetical protein
LNFNSTAAGAVSPFNATANIAANINLPPGSNVGTFADLLNNLAGIYIVNQNINQNINVNQNLNVNQNFITINILFGGSGSLLPTGGISIPVGVTGAQAGPATGVSPVSSTSFSSTSFGASFNVGVVNSVTLTPPVPVATSDVGSTATPEPATLSLLLPGFVGMLLVRRHRRLRLKH